MKRAVLCAAAILMATAACSVQEPQEEIIFSGQEVKELLFTAYSSEPETKTTLIQDGTLPDGQPKMITWWSPADEICIYYGASEGNKFISTNTELVQKATFSGTLNAFTGENDHGDFNYFWAVYPYDAAVSCDGESLVVNLAEEQEAVAGSYANKTNVTIAKAPGLSLGFYNVCSYLRFYVEKEGVISATFRGNNNEDVAGQFSVTIGNDGKPTAPTIINGEKEITLRRPNDEPFVVGESYYFVLLPQTFENGFTVQFDTEEETGSRVISVSAAFTRNNINYGNTAFDHGITYISTMNSSEPLTFTSTGNTSIALEKNGTLDVVLEYRTGNSKWAPYTISTQIALADGESLQFRAGEDGNGAFSSYSSYYKIAIYGTGTVEASGNIMSLLDRNLVRDDMPEFGFYCFFKDCDELVKADHLKLPATTLASHCYDSMFHGCTSLTSAPELPATTLANYCYRYMFYGCTSLTSAPELPATTLAKTCYSYMFHGCTSLTSAPELPAATLAESCYSYMFEGCTELIFAPELPATTLASNCYSYMFSDCTSLTAAPELPATTLASSCYSAMFRACTSLTSAPELPATTLASNCYSGMFHGCTSLTSAPELPATTLAYYCYDSMFGNCTSLTSAPELPATTLVSFCYNRMFRGCYNLAYIKMLATDISASNCLYYWVYDVSATGTFVKSSSATWNVKGISGVPSGWTVLIE